MRLGVSADEAHGHAAIACAAGAADSVHMIHRRAWQVVIDDHLQLLDVDAACGHFGSDEHLQAPRLEVCQHLAAPALAEFAMKRGCADAGATELFSDDFSGVLGGDEHQHTVVAMLLHKMPQQLGATVRIDFDGTLRDDGGANRRRGGCYASRVVQHAVRQRLDVGWEGR